MNYHGITSDRGQGSVTGKMVTALSLSPAPHCGPPPGGLDGLLQPARVTALFSQFPGGCVSRCFCAASRWFGESLSGRQSLPDRSKSRREEGERFVLAEIFKSQNCDRLRRQLDASALF